MIFTNASSRALAFTTVVAGVLVACSSDSNNPAGGAGGTGGAAGSSAGGAGGTSSAGSSTMAGTTAMAGTTTMAGSGGTAGASGGVGGGGTGGAGGAGGGGAGGGGTGGSGGTPVVADCSVDPAGLGEGEILYERWDDVPGVTVIPQVYFAPVSDTAVLTELRQQAQNLEDFQSRIRGFLTAPLAGTYRFWVSGDDNTELWLSTSELPADAVRVAWIDAWSNDLEWNKVASQKSADITLVQGTRYYIELRQKEGNGGDHMAVGWQLPGETGLVPCEVVPGSALTPFEPIGAGGAGGADAGGAGGAP